jgi:hypothetical protein
MNEEEENILNAVVDIRLEGISMEELEDKDKKCMEVMHKDVWNDEDWRIVLDYFEPSKEEIYNYVHTRNYELDVFRKQQRKLIKKIKKAKRRRR